MKIKTFGVVARIKAPEGYIGRWVNIYTHDRRGMNSGLVQTGGAYCRRIEADYVAKNHRHDCVYIHVKAS